MVSAMYCGPKPEDAPENVERMFHADVAEKAKIAASGSAGKNRRAKQKTYSWQELRAKNGPVVTFSLRKPMPFGTFQQMDQKLQKEYLTNLYAAYGGTDTSIAQMFDVSIYQVVKAKRALSVAGRPRGLTKGAQWDAFIAGELADIAPADSAAIEATVKQRPARDNSHAPVVANTHVVASSSIAESQNECAAEAPVSRVAETRSNAANSLVRSFTIELSGVHSWDDLQDALKGIPLPDNASITVSVSAGN